jgi:hypothetical protein
MFKRILAGTICAISFGAAANGTVLNFNDLTFETNVPQSSWGTGAASEISDTIPFLADWEDDRSLGGVTD